MFNNAEYYEITLTPNRDTLVIGTGANYQAVNTRNLGKCSFTACSANYHQVHTVYTHWRACILKFCSKWQAESRESSFTVLKQIWKV